MNLIAALERLLKARRELITDNEDDFIELDWAIDDLCKVLGLSRQHLEQGCY